jgi:hypothetical protein
MDAKLKTEVIQVFESRIAWIMSMRMEDIPASPKKVAISCKTDLLPKI